MNYNFVDGIKEKLEKTTVYFSEQEGLLRELFFVLQITEQYSAIKSK